MGDGLEICPQLDSRVAEGWRRRQVALVAFLIGACWSCTRSYAALACFIVVLTGIIAIASASLFTCFLWLAAVYPTPYPIP